MTKDFWAKYAVFIYIILWIVYNLQDILMLKGLIAQFIFVALMAMSFYACYEVNNHYRVSPYIKWLNIMLTVLTLYGAALMVGGEAVHKGRFLHKVVSNYSYLQGIYISVMPIYAFYYYTLKRQLVPQNIIVVFLLLFSFSVVSYYQQYFKVSYSSGKDDIVNNIGFLFVPLIPMLSIVKMKSIWKYSLALLSFGFIMLSMKRGAILTGGVMLILFLKHNLVVRTKTQIASTLVLLATAIFIIYRFVMSLYTTNVFFHKRFELTLGGYSSGRDKLYTFFWHYFTEKTSALEFLFGHGANGTVTLYGQYAHNDWLEFAINQGLLGIIMYVVYWCALSWEWKYCPNTNVRQSLGDTIIAYFLISFFSMSYTSMPLTASLCIGYCLALSKREKQINSLKQAFY